MDQPERRLLRPHNPQLFAYANDQAGTLLGHRLGHELLSRSVSGAWKALADTPAGTLTSSPTATRPAASNSVRHSPRTIHLIGAVVTAVR